MKIRNVFIIFVVSGFWHGANWTFIVWGALNAIYFLPLLLTKNNRKNIEIVAQGKLLPTLKELFFILITFILTVFAWIFFRADNISHAYNYILEIFSSSLFTFPSIKQGISGSFSIIILTILFLIIEWIGREKLFAFAHLMSNLNKPLRYLTYCIVILIIFYYTGKEQPFIYFQF